MWSLIFVSFCFLRSTVGERDCGIQAPNNDRFQLFLRGFRWVTPADNYNGTKTSVRHGETVSFTCDNGFVKDDLVGRSYAFECRDGKFNSSLSYEDLLCKSDFHKNTKSFRVSGVQLGSQILKCDGNGLEVYRVTASKSDGSLKHLYDVCFDKNVMRTKFVFQPKRNETPQLRRDSRRDVWGFDFFGSTAMEKLKLSDGYVSRIQKKRITNAFPNRYNKNNKYPYTFNRGHLAPYSDFVDPEDKKASCEYINVAPQWKEFNGNSWSVVEREAREMVGSDPSRWEVYTGTYGHIPTTRGPLFVSPFFDQNGKFLKGFVPVPKLYWKLVYNLSHRNLSRVYVGVNNPELKSPNEFTDKYLICKPKPGEQGAFKGSEFKGFYYECNLDEFLYKLGKDEGIVKTVTPNFTS